MYSLFSYAIFIGLLIFLYLILNEQAKSLNLKKGKSYLNYSPYAIAAEELKEGRYESALAFLKVHIVNLMWDIKGDKKEIMKRFKLIKKRERRLIKKNKLVELINEYKYLILQIKNLQDKVREW
jgi:hypothetical protein